MTSLQQLQSKIQKAKYPCGECERKIDCCNLCPGDKCTKTLDCPCHEETMKNDCTKCQGTGTDIPLEVGCEVKTIISNVKYLVTEVNTLGEVRINNQPSWYPQDEIINLGKPIDLQDILVVMGMNYAIDGSGEVVCLGMHKEFYEKNIKLDLTKTIAEQDEETIKALLELIS